MLLLAVLYLFLLAVLRAIRADLRRAAETAAAPDARQAGRAGAIGRLVVVDPGNTSLQVGAALPLQPSTRLGRSGRNTIVLDDAFVSSDHAVITNRDGACGLADRESTNGTYVNDAPVRGEVQLSPDDVIGIGNVRLRVAP